MTKKEIVDICATYGIENYKINSDMTVDVDGDVFLSGRKLTQLPLNFGRVSRLFLCDNNNLTTLKGCPMYVGNSFGCSFNLLTNLEGCPEYVGGEFRCSANYLVDLSGLPMNFHIKYDFICRGRDIDMLEKPEIFGRLFFGYIGGFVYTNNDKLNDFLNDNKNPPKKDLPRILSELRKIQL